jgi:hypothetical protein
MWSARRAVPTIRQSKGLEAGFPAVFMVESLRNLEWDSGSTPQLFWLERFLHSVRDNTFIGH